MKQEYKLWTFQALDTLFFRDGTPFRQGEGGMAQPTGYFPPYMSTMQGAIRTALALRQGWTPQKQAHWPEKLGTYEHLGDLKLRGPYLRFNQERLFPIPLTLIGKYSAENKKWQLTRLIPSETLVECDLGSVYLPEPQEHVEGAKNIDGWLPWREMEKLLAGKKPSLIYVTDDLWNTELHVGIRRDRKTRTAEDQHLYTTTHIRPKQGLQIEVEVGGIPEAWHLQETDALPLGGEGRMAHVSVSHVSESFPAIPKLKQDPEYIYFTVTLITPGYFGSRDNIYDVIQNGPSEVPGECVSACTGKMQQMGGWDMVNHCPRPLLPLIPAGSTWFFKAKKNEYSSIKQLHGQCIGEMTEYGMGQIVIGVWQEGEENQ